MSEKFKVFEGVCALYLVVRKGIKTEIMYVFGWRFVEWTSYEL